MRYDNKAIRSPWPFMAADPQKPLPRAPRRVDDADVQLSESGAVLGRPDLLHGAYGMVKGKSTGEAPSPDERAIRGLGQNAPPKDSP